MRARLLVPAVLSAVIGACGSAAPPSTVPVPSTSAPTSPMPSTTVPVPSPSAPIELDADVDIGGRTMRLVCVGPTDVDEPTILLEAGFGDNHGSWTEVMREMEPAHRL